MLRYYVPPVTISGQHGRIWTTQPNPCQSQGLVAVLQVPASKFSEAVRSPSFTVVAMDSRADMLVTADTKGQVYVFDIRQNRYNCLDKVGLAGTAALIQGPRSVFVAFADSSIRCYDASKGIAVGVLREHRSPVRHLEANRELNELLSTSVDAVLVWDLKKLRRKRVLGSGPYGALQASYTPDGQAVVTQFKDGSFYIWAAGSFALLRSFTLPVAPPLRPAQTSFCLSPDGQLLVACGPGLPILLVYSVIGGELRYGVGLPASPSPLDVAVAAATAAAPPPPAVAALASSLPMSVGVQQARFLPDSTTLAALLTDGSVAFVDVVGCRFMGCVPYQFPNRRDCGFASDARMLHMALRANGKVMLYDMANSRAAVDPPQPLRRVEVSQLDDLAAAVALEHLRRQQEGPDPEQDPGADQQTPPTSEDASPLIPDTQAVPDKPPTPRGSGLGRGDRAVTAKGASGGQAGLQAQAAAGGSTLAAAAQKPGQKPPGLAPLPPKHGRAGAAAGSQAGALVLDAAPPRGPAPVSASTARTATGPSSPRGLTAAVKPDAAAVSLNRTRLEALLEAFGEYPAKYRLMIWEFLLQLPHNTAAFASLAGLGMHDAFKDLPSRLPLANRALVQRLAATLSQLAHWCPVFAESSFLPDLVFPFVKLFATTPGMFGGAGGRGGGARASAGLNEQCFETLATLLCGGWMRGWWERFPHPPLGLLTRLQDLILLHDAPLGRHFATYRGGLSAVVWPHLATMWTELLTRGDWLRLWDHCITAGPDLLYHFVAAYWIALRTPLMALDTDHKLANWLAGPPEIDMGEVLKAAYQLRGRTPPELQPVPADWQPLPQGPTYIEFKGFPAGAVELFAADRARIRDAEEAIMRRRAVVSELEMRTKAVALQAASLSTERQQLAALEQERRAMMRQLEADTATELARLDDRAKEEKLKQIAAVEKAYQDNLLEVRATWQREMEYARAELAHKRAMAAQQIRSRQEDEQIKALEFHAQQRMQAMEEDVRRAAVASAVRDELLAHQMEAEAKQRAKAKEWETEDEARRLRLQAETSRRAQLATVAEEAAARSAAAREAQAVAMHIDDQLIKVEGERRLRRLAEDAALVTAEARAAEEARVAARLAAEQEELRLRAQADTAWYEAEQMRREQMLVQERQQMEAAAAAARRKLLDTEAAARAMAAQSELLERRRFLERQNAAEEAQLQLLVGAMAAERGRDAVLVSELEAKQEEMRAKLDHVARMGSLQREVESREAAAAAALLAQLDEQQRRELGELRRAQQEALERLGRDLEGQALEAAARRRAELQAEQLAALRAQQLAFERRKQELERDLAVQAERRARSHTPPQSKGDLLAHELSAPPSHRPQPAPHPPQPHSQPQPSHRQPARSDTPSSGWASSSVAPSVNAARPAGPAPPSQTRPEERASGSSLAGGDRAAVAAVAPLAAAAVEPSRPPLSAAHAAALELLRRAAVADASGSSGVLTPTRTYDTLLSDSNLTPASYVTSSNLSSTITSPELPLLPHHSRPRGPSSHSQLPPSHQQQPQQQLAAQSESAATLAAEAFAPTPAPGATASRQVPQPPAGAGPHRPAGAAAAPGEPLLLGAGALRSVSSTPAASGSASSDTTPLWALLGRGSGGGRAALLPAASSPSLTDVSAAASVAGGALGALGGGDVGPSAGMLQREHQQHQQSQGRFPRPPAAGAGAAASAAAGGVSASQAPASLPASPRLGIEREPSLSLPTTAGAPGTGSSASVGAGDGALTSGFPSGTSGISGISSTSLLSSSARLPGRGDLERSAGAALTAATAVQRAALAVAQAVSPERSRWDPRFGATRHSTPSSITGGLSRDPESDFGTATTGAAAPTGLGSGLGPTSPGGGLGRSVAARSLALDRSPGATERSETESDGEFRRLLAELYGNTAAAASNMTSPASGSMLIGSSLASSWGLPSGLSTARDAAAAIQDLFPSPAPAEPLSRPPATAAAPAPGPLGLRSEASSSPSQASVSSLSPPLLSSGGTVAMGAAGGNAGRQAGRQRAASVPLGTAGGGGGGGVESVSVTTAMSTDSWSSLQRSGLLGLAQPASLPLHSHTSGPARPRAATLSQPGGAAPQGRYDASTASSFGTSSAHSPAVTSTGTGGTGTGGTGTDGAHTATSYSSYSSFTPAVRPQERSQPPQSSQHQKPAEHRSWGYPDGYGSSQAGVGGGGGLRSATSTPAQTVSTASLQAPSSIATSRSAADPLGAAVGGVRPRAASAADPRYSSLTHDDLHASGSMSSSMYAASSTGAAAGAAALAVPPVHQQQEQQQHQPRLSSRSLHTTVSEPVVSPAGGGGDRTHNAGPGAGARPDPYTSTPSVGLSSGYSSGGFVSATDSSGLTSLLLGAGFGGGGGGEAEDGDGDVSMGMARDWEGYRRDDGRGSRPAVHSSAHGARSSGYGRGDREGSGDGSNGGRWDAGAEGPDASASATSARTHTIAATSSAGSGGGVPGVTTTTASASIAYNRSSGGGGGRGGADVGGSSGYVSGSGELLRSGLGGTDDGGVGSSEAASAGHGGGAGTTGSSSYGTRSSLTRGSPLTNATGRTADTANSGLSSYRTQVTPETQMSESLKLQDGDSSVAATPADSTARGGGRTGPWGPLFSGPGPTASRGGSSSGGVPSPDVANLLRQLRLTSGGEDTGRWQEGETETGTEGSALPPSREPPVSAHPSTSIVVSQEGGRASARSGDEGRGSGGGARASRHPGDHNSAESLGQSDIGQQRPGPVQASTHLTSATGPGELAVWYLEPEAEADTEPLSAHATLGFGSRVGSITGSDSEGDRNGEGAAGVRAGSGAGQMPPAGAALASAGYAPEGRVGGTAARRDALIPPLPPPARTQLLPPSHPLPVSQSLPAVGVLGRGLADPYHALPVTQSAPAGAASAVESTHMGATWHTGAGAGSHESEQYPYAGRPADWRTSGIDGGSGRHDEVARGAAGHERSSGGSGGGVRGRGGWQEISPLSTSRTESHDSTTATPGGATHFAAVTPGGITDAAAATPWHGSVYPATSPGGLLSPLFGTTPGGLTADPLAATPGGLTAVLGPTPGDPPAHTTPTPGGGLAAADDTSSSSPGGLTAASGATPGFPGGGIPSHLLAMLPTPGGGLSVGASGDSPGGLTDLDASLQRLEAGLRWGTSQHHHHHREGGDEDDGGRSHTMTPSTSTGTPLFYAGDPRWLLTGVTMLTDSSLDGGGGDGRGEGDVQTPLV